MRDGTLAASIPRTPKILLQLRVRAFSPVGAGRVASPRRPLFSAVNFFPGHRFISWARCPEGARDLRPWFQPWEACAVKRGALKGRHMCEPNRTISGGGDRNRFSCPLRAIFITTAGWLVHRLLGENPFRYSLYLGRVACEFKKKSKMRRKF